LPSRAGLSVSALSCGLKTSNVRTNPVSPGVALPGMGTMLGMYPVPPAAGSKTSIAK
jgi:hypothetical protein